MEARARAIRRLWQAVPRFMQGDIVCGIGRMWCLPENHQQLPKGPACTLSAIMHVSEESLMPI